MKHLLLIITLLIYGLAYSQIVSIPDSNFKNTLLSANSSVLIAKDANNNLITIDVNNDNEIQVSEAENVAYLRLYDKNISDLTGIEAFVNLTFLNCSVNNLTSLDVSSNKKLKTLRCLINNIKTLDFTKNLLLTHLYCKQNNLETLNISSNTELIHLDCVFNKLISLDTSTNIKLNSLICSDNNNLNTLNLSNNVNLEVLWCADNRMTNLNISNNPKLTELSCGINPGLLLDLSNNPVLAKLSCQKNFVPVDVTNNPELTHLTCYYNNLTELNVSNNTKLAYISCQLNKLTELDVSNSTKLILLDCSNNDITTINVSNSPVLRQFYCKENPKLEYINIQNGNNDNMSINTKDLPLLTDVCIDELNSNLANTILSQTGHNVNFSTACDVLLVENYNMSNFLIFPIPANDILTVKSKSEIIEIQVYNKLAQLILENKKESQIDLSSFLQGIYFVKVKDADGNIGIKKIIKN